MKVTRKTETSVFLTSLNQADITAALEAASLSTTDNFDIRTATMEVTQGEIVAPVAGWEIVHCTVSVEEV